MANVEGLVLDGLDLNSETGDYSLEEIAFPPPRKRQEWAQSGDSDGAALVRDPLFDNREITAKIRIQNQASMDTALAKIGTLVDKLEESEKQENGLALVWTPSQSTKTVTFYVLSGEVDDVPIAVDSGWFVKFPVVTLRLTCKPFGYGAEVTSITTTSAEPLIEKTISGVAGDVPAEARLIVSDNAAQTRRHVEWGVQNRFYNTLTNLMLDSDSMVTAGFSGTGTTRTGAYDPGAVGSSVVRGTLAAYPVAICGTGTLSHVGTFRVKARVYASNATADYTQVRLTWQQGDGPFTSNAWTSPAFGANWGEVDLGLVHLSEKQLGTQRWTGKVEAYTDGGTPDTDTIDIDYLLFIPAGEGYGKGRAPFVVNAPSVFTARDEFNQSAGSTTGKTLPVGGTWQGSGDADDFVMDTILHTITRNPAGADAALTSGRILTAGTSTYTTTAVQAGGAFISSTPGNDVVMGPLARYVDTSNWAALLVRSNASSARVLEVWKYKAGVLTTLKSEAVTLNSSLLGAVLRLVITANGRWFAYYNLGGTGGLTPTASMTLLAEGYDTDFATGGTLASGRNGIYAATTTTTNDTVAIDNFYAWSPTEDAVAYSTQSCEIRHDGAIREDSTGTYWGNVGEYRGSRFYLPPAGDENRTSRVAVKLRRNDVDESPDDSIADSTQVAIAHTPRYSVIPR